MMRPRLIVMLIAVASLLLCVSAGFADSTRTEWQECDWDCQANPIHPGTPYMETSWEWDSAWPVSTSMDPLYTYELYGDAPDPVDPDVSQTIRNRTSVSWTDWHVDLTNGTYVPGSAVVYNVQASAPAWEIVELGDGKGFWAHVISGEDTQVDQYEQLSVFFSYTVDDPLQQVSIQQYPTDFYPIPEPATILSLLAGCAAFGFRLKRRA